MLSNWLKSLRRGNADQQRELMELRSQVAAVGKAQGVIAFDPDGVILAANENFCRIMGYTLEEIHGQHDRMFVDPGEAGGADYRQLWDRLRRGEFESRQYRRIAKGGREVWIQADYTPICDASGKTLKVVQYVVDVTSLKLKSADFEGQVAAINKVQAVIEFRLDGTIVTANDKFCQGVGYALDEIRGQHHRMFVPADYAETAEYRAFWARLNQGELLAGRYLRIGKGGREVWLQATYCPILDMHGRPFKVIKYAIDITEQVLADRQTEVAFGEVAALIFAARNGDLTQRVPTAGKTGKVAALCSDVNDLVDSMSDIIRTIRVASTTITAAATEISTGNTDLSRRTELSASNLQTTAASTEELTVTVRRNADNADEANRMALEASQVAADGGVVVGKVVATMKEINESSRRIGDIIAVIDGIAFQTNILALNAAVEAARAGEQGRGFAVVATEVRSLAQRSATAAKEIRTLIAESVGKVEAGTKLVGTAGSTMSEVVKSIDRVTKIISEITLASQEQRTGIEQVSHAVNGLEETTQQNAALVEEAAAAAESLVDQAQDMLETVSAFSIEDGSGVVAQPRRLQKA